MGVVFHLNAKPFKAQGFDEKGVNAYSVVAPARRSKNKTENDTPPTLSYFRDEQFGLALATVSSHFSIMNPCSSLLNCFFIQKKFCSVKFCWKESNSLVTSHDTILFVKMFHFYCRPSSFWKLRRVLTLNWWLFPIEFDRCQLT